MKIHTRIYIHLTVALGFLGACKKETISTYSTPQASVYFIYTNNLNGSVGNIDSLNYTFVEKNSTVQKDTIWLPARIAGLTADHDRPIKLMPVAGATTAVRDVHYKLLDYTMPKDSFQTTLGIVLLRDPSLQDTSVTLELQLQTTTDFPVSMTDTLMADGRFNSRNNIRIVFTDRLIKPSNWDNYLIVYFGAYSNTKFRFMAGILGRSSFPSTGPDAIKLPQFFYYQNVMRNALTDYNMANGPMIDENGNAVVFP